MLSLKATIRTQFGKRNKKLRKEGFLPGVLYGRKIESMPLSINYKDFYELYKEVGESALVSIDLEGAETSKENVVLIRDVVTHPLTQKFIHTDFYQVPLDEEITITVPISFENEAPAVKDEGGVLIRNVYEISVSALPKNLPRELTVDLSSLDHIDDLILVKDLSVPEGTTIDAEDDLMVVSVSAPKEEVIEEEVSEEVAPEEIKTEAEEKREEEEAAEEPAPQ